jgi:outer membrane immunogenic protein
MSIKTLFLGTVSATLIAAPVLAGSPTPAAVEPAVQVPVAVPLTGDWTGGYVGGQIGFGKVGGDLSGDDVIGGLTMGYDYDFGQWVLGAGLDYDWANIDAGGNTLENVARLKLRAGYDMGPGLIYATAGAARADIDTLGSDDGYFAGVGYEHMVSDNMSIGGELLYHDFGDFNGSGINVDATTAQVRATFRF